MEKEDFLFGLGNFKIHGDKTESQLLEINNLTTFYNHVQVATNMVIGGKMEPEDAYKRIKKWYKIMKKSHKALKNDRTKD